MIEPLALVVLEGKSLHPPSIIFICKSIESICTITEGDSVCLMLDIMVNFLFQCDVVLSVLLHLSMRSQSVVDNLENTHISSRRQTS